MYGVDCCYKLSGFPETYKEAMESPDAKHWEEAMREEMRVDRQWGTDGFTQPRKAHLWLKHTKPDT